MVLQTLIGQKVINKENLVTTLVPIITRGVVSRRQAESFVQEPQMDIEAVMQAQEQAQEIQEQQANQPLIAPDMLQGISPQDMQEISDAYSMSMSPAGMGGGMTEAIVDTGYDNYQAGIENNDPLKDLPL